VYEVSDLYKEKIAEEEVTPIKLLKVNTGYYWNRIDNMETDNWEADATCAEWSQTWSTAISRSATHSYMYELTADGTNQTFVYECGAINKEFVFSSVNGLSVYFYVDWDLADWYFSGTKYGMYYAQLILGGEVVAEKDIANSIGRWDTLQYIGSINGTWEVQLKIECRAQRVATGSTPPKVYFDNLYEYVQDTPLYLTDGSEDFEWYDPGTTTERTYTAFPFQVSDLKSSLTGQVEGATVSIANASLEIMSLLLTNDALYGEEVDIIQTFYECRRGGPDDDYTCYQKDTYEIDKASADEKNAIIAFVLKSKFSVNKVHIPLEPFDRDYCRHEYKDPITCKYNGRLAECDKTKSGENGCGAHDNTMNFGGCPGIPSMRIIAR
jgi:phage-related protein